mgnify:CR=1 FL=1
MQLCVVGMTGSLCNFREEAHNDVQPGRSRRRRQLCIVARFSPSTFLTVANGRFSGSGAGGGAHLLTAVND